MNKLKIKTSYVGLKIQGQGVGAATIEQINLLKDRCSEEFSVLENKGRGDILHVHTKASDGIGGPDDIAAAAARRSVRSDDSTGR